MTGERFLGTPEGASLNGDRLRTRECASLGEAILYSTVPEMFVIPPGPVVTQATLVQN